MELVRQLTAALELLEQEESAEIDRVRAAWAERRAHLHSVIASIPSPALALFKVGGSVPAGQVATIYPRCICGHDAEVHWHTSVGKAGCYATGCECNCYSYFGEVVDQAVADRLREPTVDAGPWERLSAAADRLRESSAAAIAQIKSSAAAAVEPTPVMVGGDDLNDDGEQVGTWPDDIDDVAVARCDGSASCPVRVTHTHGCLSDYGACDQPDSPDHHRAIVDPAPAPESEPEPAVVPVERASRVGGGAAVMTREDWARVVALVDQEEAAGRSPRHAIAAEFGVPVSTAKNWPARARSLLAAWATEDTGGDVDWLPVADLPLDRLEEVAVVAREAFRSTKPILSAIERKFDVSHSAADELLGECRRRGVLPPKGQPLEQAVLPDRVASHRSGAGDLL